VPSIAEKQAPAPDVIEYILLLGFDRSKGWTGRTDAILVSALNYTTGHIGVISIPRDLYVDIPGLSPGRINTVFRVGNRELGPGKGLAALKRIIKRDLGIPIKYTVAIDFRGFAKIVDALGGIEVDIRCPIEDCFLTENEEEPCIPLSLTAGTHHLDGATALLFARSRHGRADSDRARRQQAVLVGLKNRLKRPGILTKLPKLWLELSRYVATDLDLKGMLRIATLAAGTTKDSIHGLVLRPPIVESRRTPDGKQVVELNPKAFRSAKAKLFTAPPPGKRKRTACPPADVGLHWRERVRARKGKDPAPLVSQTDQ
jgi:LCP family protein required for cell wall assembly